MVREPDVAPRPTPQDNQLMSKHRVFSFKPCLRLEWRGQDGQREAEQPDHPASLGDSITASHSGEVFGTHTTKSRPFCTIQLLCAAAEQNSNTGGPNTHARRELLLQVSAVALPQEAVDLCHPPVGQASARRR